MHDKTSNQDVPIFELNKLKISKNTNTSFLGQTQEIDTV